jgi:hypothetical protein
VCKALGKDQEFFKDFIGVQDDWDIYVGIFLGVETDFGVFILH